MFCKGVNSVDDDHRWSLKRHFPIEWRQRLHQPYFPVERHRLMSSQCPWRSGIFIQVWYNMYIAIDGTTWFIMFAVSFRIQKAKRTIGSWTLWPLDLGPWYPVAPTGSPLFPTTPTILWVGGCASKRNYLTTSYDTLHHSASLKRKGTATGKGHLYKKKSEGAEAKHTPYVGLCGCGIFAIHRGVHRKSRRCKSQFRKLQM